MLKTSDGGVLYRDWTSVSPRAIVIFVHGMGGYSGRFFEMGPYFAKAGFQVYAIEQRGHGENPTPKGHIDNFKLYTSDLKSLVTFAKSKNPGKKLFIFGESMGGLITLDFTLHNQKLIEGIILMSPALKEKLPMSPAKRLSIFFSSIFKPMTYYGSEFDAGMFTRDKVMAKRIDADTLEVRKFTAKFYSAIIKSMIYVGMRARRIKLPVLMILGGKDLMIDAVTGGKYFGKIGSKVKTLKWYPEMYHALYVDKDRENVFKDMVDWINMRLQEGK
jgi:alpha-beta hydrolase superfamily lysophospholipase